MHNISVMVIRVFAAFVMLFLILFFTLCACTVLSDWDKYGIKTSLWFSEYKVEYSNGGFGDFTNYSEYHFNDKSIQKFEKSKWYRVVTNEDVDSLQEYFDNFEGWLEWCDYADKYSFDKDTQINSGDYFHIYTLEGKPIGQSSYGKFDYYDIYYVDVESCTVYYIHTNI